MQSSGVDQWKETLALKLAQIENNGTLVAASEPEGRQALTSKFALKKELNAEGNIFRYEVRLVVHCYKQRYGFDFDGTYAPVF